MVSFVSSAVALVTIVPRLLSPIVDPADLPDDSPIQLGMISREGWGAAAPEIETSNEGAYDLFTNPSGWMVYDQPLDQVLRTLIIHHSALPLSDGPREI